MKYIVKRIDDIGRIHIPKSLRRALDIKDGDPVKITLVGDGIMVTKYDAEIDSVPENSLC